MITLGVVLGLVKNRWGKQPIVENNKQPTTVATTSAVLKDIDTSNWKTYRNEELGFEFMHPSNCKVDINNNVEIFDTGKKTVVSLSDRCENKIIFTFTSEDYSVGVGEGCCFYYPGSPIDVSSLDKINILVKDFKPMDVKKIKISDRDAIHFYGSKGYVDRSLVDYILLPYSRDGFANLLIESPALFTSQYEEGKTSETQEQEIVESFNNQKYLKNLDRDFNTVVKSLNLFNGIK